MAFVARAIERGETKGLMKIVINADNDRILGATILGAEGGELVQILMALMMADAPWTLVQERHVHSPDAGRRLLLPHGQRRGRQTA